MVSSYEDWEPDGQVFDLVIAATSFHWIDPAVAYVKSAAVLRPTGSLAVFSNTHIRQDQGFFHRAQDLYRALAPSMMGAARSTNAHDRKPVGVALFSEPEERRYQWATEYTAMEYVDLLGTYSDHISLPDGERRELFESIADMIEREYDGQVLKHYETVLRLYSGY